MEQGDLSLTGQASEERVLVVVMNNPRDFRLLQEEGWYRIPVRRAPRQVAADFLAFYQTGAFPEERWSIRYYAAVKGYRLVKRSELLPAEATHPRANDYYFKVEIGPLQTLPRPIPSRKLRRITFIPTTLQRLLRAREVNDLWEGPPSAERLWQALRSSGIEAERELEIREGRAAYHLDLAIFCQRGKVGVECLEEPGEVADPLARPWPEALRAKGWSLLRFSRKQLDDLQHCVETIKERIAACGGLEEVRAADEETI